jgi:methionine-rich copper-binding protein CopC
MDSVRTLSCAILCAAILAAPTAQAHAKLVSAEPAPHSSVAAPTTIHLHFSEELAKKFSSVRLSNAAGASLSVTPLEADDAKSLAAAPAAPLTAGVYKVSWTAVSSDDGHKMTGSYTFTVK